MLGGSTQFLLLITAGRHVTPPLPPLFLATEKTTHPPTPPIKSKVVCLSVGRSLEVCPLPANLLHFLQGGNFVLLLLKCFFFKFLILTQLLWDLHKQLKQSHEAAVSLSGLVVLGTGQVL